MATGLKRTVELLEQFIESKQNLADTLVSKGEEASAEEPFDDLVQKAADYIPKSYIFLDPNGNEIAGALVDQETIFDATENDVREGKVFASDVGIKTGTKFIPSYNTTEGYQIILPGSNMDILIPNRDLYNYTRLQAIVCTYDASLAKSVGAVKVVVENNVYNVQSTAKISSVTIDSANRSIKLGVVNDTLKPLIIRFFTYKEIK